MREISEDDKADNLIKQYIELSHKKDASYLRLSDVHWHFSGRADDKMVSEIQRAHDEMRGIEIEALFKKINRQEEIEAISERATKYTLTRVDYEVLARFDEPDFLAFLQRHGGNRSVNDFVQHFLSGRPSFADRELEHQEIRSKIIPVIKKAAQESRLNHLRLKGYLNAITAASEADAGEQD